jgi:hypothetical protein
LKCSHVHLLFHPYSSMALDRTCDALYVQYMNQYAFTIVHVASLGTFLHFEGLTRSSIKVRKSPGFSVYLVREIYVQLAWSIFSRPLQYEYNMDCITLLKVSF